VKLTPSDHRTLARAVEMHRRFAAGIFPKGSGQYRHFAKLERLGLIRFDNWGRDIDGESEGDVPVYQITDAGRAALPEVDR
jgi:hypothetical protein